MFTCKLLETSDYDVALFELKELLLSVGWSVPIASSKWSTVKSWFVLRHPVNEMEFLFQRGKKSNQWWISCSEQRFSGGTDMIRPTVINEEKLFHNGAGEANKIKTVKKWCYGVSDTSFYMIGLDGSRIEFCIFNDNKIVFCGNRLHHSAKMLDDGKFISIDAPNVVGSSGENFIAKKVSQPNGSIFENQLVIDGVLFPWTIDVAPVEFSPPPEPAVIAPIVKTNSPVKSKYKYKMVGKLDNNNEITYHSWVVIGSPDFAGDKAKIGPLTNIYIADRWK
jgi:hypothetical protein